MKFRNDFNGRIKMWAYYASVEIKKHTRRRSDKRWQYGAMIDGKWRIFSVNDDNNKLFQTAFDLAWMADMVPELIEDGEYQMACEYYAIGSRLMTKLWRQSRGQKHRSDQLANQMENPKKRTRERDRHLLESVEQLVGRGETKTRAVLSTAADFDCSDATVYRALRKFKK